MAQDSNRKNDDLLSSWKEIAAYLGYDERTCIRWEKQLGLPVHRVAGFTKSRIFASKIKLDRWRTERFLNKSFSQPSLHRKLLPNRALYFAIILVLALLFYLFLNLLSPSIPTDFKIDKSDLVILNKKGNELWRYPTGIEDLVEEKRYRDHFQQQKKFESKGTDLPHLIMKDINKDGKIEVLFSTQTKDEYGEGELFCLDHKGIQLWKFIAGGELKSGQNVYSADYRINGIYADDLDSDGNLEIIVISVQMPDWPCQLIVLNNMGETIGEYWNAGHFSEIFAFDLGEDKKKEIIAAGVNNEYGKACIVVFDSYKIRGCSPQGEDKFICKEIEKGNEKYYILLPRTDVDLQESNPVEAIKRIDMLKDRRIRVETQSSGIFYEFDNNLVLQELPRSSHFFEMKHKQAVADGRVSSILNDKYWANLGRAVLYWDGKNWVSKPSMNH